MSVLTPHRYAFQNGKEWKEFVTAIQLSFFMYFDHRENLLTYRVPVSELHQCRTKLRNLLEEQGTIISPSVLELVNDMGKSWPEFDSEGKIGSQLEKRIAPSLNWDQAMQEVRELQKDVAEFPQGDSLAQGKDIPGHVRHIFQREGLLSRVEPLIHLFETLLRKSCQPANAESALRQLDFKQTDRGVDDRPMSVAFEVEIAGELSGQSLNEAERYIAGKSSSFSEFSTRASTK